MYLLGKQLSVDEGPWQRGRGESGGCLRPRTWTPCPLSPRAWERGSEDQRASPQSAPGLSLLGPLVSGGPAHSRVTTALRGSSECVCGQVGSESPLLELGDLAGAAPRAPRPVCCSVRRREAWAVASSPAWSWAVGVHGQGVLPGSLAWPWAVVRTVLPHPFL